MPKSSQVYWSIIATILSTSRVVGWTAPVTQSETTPDAPKPATKPDTKNEMKTPLGKIAQKGVEWAIDNPVPATTVGALTAGLIGFTVYDTMQDSQRAAQSKQEQEATKQRVAQKEKENLALHLERVEQITKDILNNLPNNSEGSASVKGISSSAPRQENEEKEIALNRRTKEEREHLNLQKESELNIIKVKEEKL